MCAMVVVKDYVESDRAAYGSDARRRSILE